MRDKCKIILIWLVILFATFSCKKSPAQLPANKMVVINEEAQTMLEINKKLAIKEDSILKALVSTKYKSFTKNELGFWYNIEKKTKNKPLEIQEKCSILYVMKYSNGAVIQKGTKIFSIGKKEVVFGLEEGVKLLRTGEKATFIIPWYLGYGMNGLNNIVPPYTTLIYEVELKQ